MRDSPRSHRPGQGIQNNRSWGDLSLEDPDLEGFQKPGQVRGATPSTEPACLPWYYKPAAYTFGQSKPSLRPQMD